MWEFAVNGRPLTSEQAAFLVPEIERLTMSTMAMAPPSSNHIGMAAVLQAKEEAVAAGEFIAKLPSKAVSTPRKVMDFLRLPQIASAVKNFAGGVGGWLAARLTPAMNFVGRIGYLPSGLAFATSVSGQRFIRFVVRTALKPVGWVLKATALTLDWTLRLFGKPGNALADRITSALMNGAQKVAMPVGKAYAVAAPIVSARSAHVRVVHVIARQVIIHRALRLFMPLWAALAVELVAIPFLSAKTRQAGAAFNAKMTERANEAKARAAVDAHIAQQAADEAKTKAAEMAKVERSVTESMVEATEMVKGMGERLGQSLGLTEPKSVEAEEAEMLLEVAKEAASLQEHLTADKVTVIEVEPDITPEQQVDAAQTVADSVGKPVTTVTTDGETVTIEPNREVRRAMDRYPAKKKSGKRS